MTIPRPVSSRTALLAALLGAVAMLTGPAQAEERPRVSVGLTRAFASRPEQPVAVWVYFTDRAGAEHDARALAAARDRLTVRSLARRARRGSLPDMVAGDLPVHEPYLRALVARGARLRGASRWLNAASAEMTPSLALEIARLPFVSRVALVPTGMPLRRVDEMVPEPTAPAPGARDDGAATGSDAAARTTAAPGSPAFYGGSFRQLDMMQVPALHALGLSGAGVLVAMLDSGFRTTHQVFVGLNVVAKRDFIHGDLNVDDEPGQDVPGQMTHGTTTLACVAGHKPDTYCGGAFAATVALGKTEDIGSETPVEMDYWQFGAEWADSLGADLISSSLGYSEFDNTGDSYTYADMDGRTTVVTLAAAEAARRGITVVNCAGNEGAVPWHFIIAPADADTVLTIGAVDSFNVVTSFSSRGPTSDGRIKPDVTAMGRNVFLPTASNDANFQRGSGTSYSTPLVAGVVALLLESHPNWGPVQVRDALRETALNHTTPDNNIGWGLVQGLAANAFVPVTGVGPGAGPVATTGLQLSAGPNPLRGGSPATIRFAAPASGTVEIDVVDIGGRRRGHLFEGSATSERSIVWRAQDRDGAPLPAGIYWIRLAEVHSAGDASERSPHPIRTVRVVVLR